MEEKIITALRSEEFYEDDQKKVLIVSLDTIEKLNEESEIVALKFNSLIQLKNDGVDVNEEIELLRERIKILIAIKELIIKKKQLEIKLINGNILIECLSWLKDMILTAINNVFERTTRK